MGVIGVHSSLPTEGPGTFSFSLATAGSGRILCCCSCALELACGDALCPCIFCRFTGTGTCFFCTLSTFLGERGSLSLSPSSCFPLTFCCCRATQCSKPLTALTQAPVPSSLLSISLASAWWTLVLFAPVSHSRTEP